MRWAGHVACMTAKINTYKIFIENPERMILFGISKCRYKKVNQSRYRPGVAQRVPGS